MNIIVKTSGLLSGAITPPPSKSHTVRAVLLATLAKGTSVIHAALDADDTQCALGVARALGAAVTWQASRERPGCLEVAIESRGTPLLPADLSLNTGNSGITTNFTLPMLGVCGEGIPAREMDCANQMRTRPVQPLLSALESLGMEITPHSAEQPWPLLVSGALQGGALSIEGSSSQYISALLLSLPLAPNDSTIVVNNLCERPYVEMTTRWLDELGITYQWHRPAALNYETHTSGTSLSSTDVLFAVKKVPSGGFRNSERAESDVFEIPGRQTYHAFEKTIPGDFSSASYALAAGVLLGGAVIVHGLDMADPQGDKRVIAVLQRMGAALTISAGKIAIHGGALLRGCDIDCNDIPDMVPTLAVVATRAHGKTRLYNVSHARGKETDRLASMAQELKKMGGQIEEKPDGLTIYGSDLHGAAVQGHHDHRTIMALALAGMVAKGSTNIDTAEGIAKTYPRFVDDMKFLGANIAMV